MAGWAAVAVAVIGAGLQYQGQRKAAKAAKQRAAATAAARRRAESLQKRREDIVASRQRRRASAESRRLRGQVVNLAATRGIGGAVGAQGSTVPGAISNIAGQLNANNAFIKRVTAINAKIRTAFTDAAIIGSQPISAGTGLMAFGGLLKSQAMNLGGLFGGSGDTPIPSSKFVGGPSQPSRLSGV